MKNSLLVPQLLYFNFWVWVAHVSGPLTMVPQTQNGRNFVYPFRRSLKRRRLVFFVFPLAEMHGMATGQPS